MAVIARTPPPKPKRAARYASPAGIAKKIAALYGAKPERITVRMIASDEVVRFVKGIEATRKKNAKLSYRVR